MRVSPAIAVAAAALVACQEPPLRAGGADTDDAKKEWREIEVKLPSYPKSENLLRFEVGDASPHRFYIDAPSLAIGKDEVVRYTLVVRTAAGATNVSFEGIRCDGRRQKYYAVGNANGTWSPARNPQWRRIQLQDPDRQRLALVDDYLCLGKSPRGTEGDILYRLKQGPVGPQFN